MMKRFIAKLYGRWVLAHNKEYTPFPDIGMVLIAQRDGESFYEFELRASKYRKECHE